MKLKTAIEIMEYHQEWRLGKKDEMTYTPKQITKALYVLLAHSRKSNSVICDNCKQIIKTETHICKECFENGVKW